DQAGGSIQSVASSAPRPEFQSAIIQQQNQNTVGLLARHRGPVTERPAPPRTSSGSGDAAMHTTVFGDAAEAGLGRSMLRPGQPTMEQPSTGTGIPRPHDLALRLGAPQREGLRPTAGGEASAGPTRGRSS